MFFKSLLLHAFMIPLTQVLTFACRIQYIVNDLVYAQTLSKCLGSLLKMKSVAAFGSNFDFLTDKWIAEFDKKKRTPD